MKKKEIKSVRNEKRGCTLSLRASYAHYASDRRIRLPILWPCSGLGWGNENV